MTLFGLHTVTEGNQFIINKDYEANFLNSTRKGLPQAPDGTWDADNDKLQAAYNQAKTIFKAAAATMAVTEPGISDDYRTSGLLEIAYKGISSSLEPKEGIVTPGYMQDLYNRLKTASTTQNVPLPVEHLPLPNPNAPDTDLTMFQKVDAFIRSGEAAAKKTATSPWFYAGVAAAVGFTFLALKPTTVTIAYPSHKRDNY